MAEMNKCLIPRVIVEFQVTCLKFTSPDKLFSYDNKFIGIFDFWGHDCMFQAFGQVTIRGVKLRAS